LESALSLRDKIAKYASRIHREERRAPSVMELPDKFNIHRVKLYSTFPAGLAEIYKKAKVPFLVNHIRLAEAMKAKGYSAKERSTEHGGFDFEYRRSDLEAKVKELSHLFQLRTENV